MPFTAASGPVMVPHTHTLTVSAARAGLARAISAAKSARLTNLLMWTSGGGGVRLDDEGERAARDQRCRPAPQAAEQRGQPARLEEQEEDDEEPEGHLAQREEQAGDVEGLADPLDRLRDEDHEGGAEERA